MPLARAELVRALEEVTRPFLAYVTALHAEAGGVTEIRIIRLGVIWAARIGPREADALVDALRPLQDLPRTDIPHDDHPRSGEGNVYFTLGPVRPDPAWPLSAELRRTRSAARNQDILAYPWVVVDLDPEREPKDRSSTDAEKAQALHVADAVGAWLSERGVRVARADSGNGYHLLARHAGGAGATVEQAAAATRALLHHLHARFSTAGAKVDITTHNPGRIFKLYGTAATKGEDTRATPHRLSWLDVGTLPAPMDVLAALVEPPSPAPAPRTSASPASRPSPPATDAHRAWRAEALARLDLAAVYGPWLTGKATPSGWLECRDPDAPSGDRHPSAGVADQVGDHERGVFHSFRQSKGMDVFDFLIARGRARNFPDACRLVAELSGVPLPAAPSAATEPPSGPSAAPPGLAELEAFAARWAATTDADARSELLERAIRVALGLSSVASAEALARLTRESGMAPGVIRQVTASVKEKLRDARYREAGARPEPSKPGIPVVEYVVDGDTVEGLFEKILAVILPLHRFFQQSGVLVFVRRGHGPVRLTDQNLPGYLCSFLELALMGQEDDGISFERYDVLPTALARAFVTSPRVASRLPVLTSYVRSPVFDKEWNFVATFGFHAPSGIFYDGPPVRPRAGDAALRRAIDDFRWKAEADRVNFIGALLTGLTMPQWSLGHPFLAINGNKPGVGKSTLATVLAAVTEGHVPAAITLTANDDEFEKQIATRIEAGDRVVVVDNARATAAIRSMALERSITAPRLNFRRLGSNTAINRPENDVLFVLTMNMTQLGPDLRRRALPLNLEVQGSVRNVRYARDELAHEVLAARLDILAELAGMVRAWVEAQRPLPVAPARHSTSQRWAATMDAILQHAGLQGFLTNLAESEHAFDEDYDLLRDMCAAHHAEGFRTAGEWAPVLVTSVLSDKLRDARGNPKSVRSQQTIVGRMLTQFVGESITIDAGTFVLREETPRKGHPSLYGFVPEE